MLINKMFSKEDWENLEKEYEKSKKAEEMALLIDAEIIKFIEEKIKCHVEAEKKEDN